MIDIFLPVLGRPQNAQRVVDSIHASTSVDYSIWFICSLGDTEQIEAAWATDAHRVLIEDFGEEHQYPRKMNRAFALSQEPFCLLGADDVIFSEGWDLEALKVAQETGAGVIGTNDRCNAQVMRGEFSTHPLVRRRYVTDEGGSADGPGVLIHEGYDHNYCDRELCHLAQSREQWAYAPKAEVIHNHPMRGKAPSDATYEKGRKTMMADLHYFFERSALWGHVGLLPQEHAFIRQQAKKARREARR